MIRELEIPENALSKWPSFEQRLRERLDARLDPESVARGMLRTRRPGEVLQLPSLVGTLDSEPAARLLR